MRSLLMGLLACALGASAARAAIPEQIHFQAHLTDDAGTPREGEVTLGFAFLDADGASIWSEEQVLEVNDGLIVTAVGVVEPLDPSVFDRDGVWFEITVDDEVLEPRYPVQAVPYAMHAGNALSEEEIRAALAGSLAPASCEDGQTIAWSEGGWACAAPSGGSPGQDGVSVVVAEEPAGDNCATGGVIVTGADGDAYVCHGAAGPEGPIGPEGPQGEPGAAVAAAEEPAGDNCPGGGVALTTPEGTTYVCDGADGTSIAAVACPEGQALVAVDAGGAPTCAALPDADTTYSGADFALSNQGCEPGQVVTGVDLDGAVTCAADMDTVYSGADFALSDQGCELGQIVIGFDVDGAVICGVDMDTTYDGADFALSDQGCAPGQVVTGIDADGVVTCVIDADVDDSVVNELNTSLVLNGAALELTDEGGTLTADLTALIDDADADAANELNASLVLNGAALEITDNGGTLVADLSGLINDADADAANELNTTLVLNGAALELTDNGGTLSADLTALIEDDDADATNELNTALALNGTVLELTDAGGVQTAELGSLVDTAEAVLAKLVTVDGTGSGLDADLLDGLEAADIIDAASAPNDDRVYIDSIPYTISEPGLYILKGNLTATVVNADGITIDSDFVTLDLNGFTLDGTTRANPPGIATDDGIVILGDQRGITIRNGVIANWGGDGINALNADNSLFENLIVFNNGGDGLVTDFGCIIRNCTARLNGIDGLEVDDGSVITGSTAYENGDNGIQTSEGCTVTNSSSFNNAVDGFDVAAGSVVHACSSTDNQAYGFDIALGSQVTKSTAYDNIRNGFDIASACVAVDNISSLNNENGFRMFANAYLRNNKSHENDRAGFRISSTDAYLEGNNATDNDDGGFVNTSSGSLLVRNTAAGNALVSIDTQPPADVIAGTATNAPLDPPPVGIQHNFYIDANSSYGPLIDVTSAGDLSGVANANHPLANLAY